jgi:hypothetical protein
MSADLQPLIFQLAQAIAAEARASFSQHYSQPGMESTDKDTSAISPKTASLLIRAMIGNPDHHYAQAILSEFQHRVADLCKQHEQRDSHGQRAAFSAAWDESRHPRKDKGGPEGGQFVKGAEIAQARKDPAARERLLSQVTDPENRAKLNRQLMSDQTTGLSKTGRTSGPNAINATHAKITQLAEKAKSGELRMSDLHELSNRLNQHTTPELDQLHKNLGLNARGHLKVEQINGLVDAAVRAHIQSTGGATPTPSDEANPLVKPLEAPSASLAGQGGKDGYNAKGFPELPDAGKSTPSKKVRQLPQPWNHEGHDLSASMANQLMKMTPKQMADAGIAFTRSESGSIHARIPGVGILRFKAGGNDAGVAKSAAHTVHVTAADAKQIARLMGGKDGLKKRLVVKGLHATILAQGKDGKWAIHGSPMLLNQGGWNDHALDLYRPEANTIHSSLNNAHIFAGAHLSAANKGGVDRGDARKQLVEAVKAQVGKNKANTASTAKQVGQVEPKEANVQSDPSASGQSVEKESSSPPQIPVNEKPKPGERNPLHDLVAKEPKAEGATSGVDVSGAFKPHKDSTMGSGAYALAKAFAESLSTTGELPSAEKNSSFGQAWEMVKSKFGNNPESRANFGKAFYDVVKNGGDGVNSKGIMTALNRHFTEPTKPAEPAPSPTTSPMTEAGRMADAQATPVHLPAEAQRTGDHAGTPIDPKNEHVYTVPTSSLKRDPKRFQYKFDGVGSKGVTKKLMGVDKWDRNAGGTVLAWRDPADGQDYVINGNHRHELADRIGYPQMNARYVTAPTAEHARAVGALANIMEGSGTALDAAKYMRDTGTSLEDFKQHGVALGEGLVQRAGHLAKLGDTTFTKVANKLIDEPTAIAVATHLDDHRMQDRLLNLVQKRADAGREMSTRAIENAAEMMAHAGKTTKTVDGGLFGDYEDEHSTWAEEAELRDHIARQLARTTNAYAAVSSDAKADMVKDAGNTIVTDKNRELRDQATGHEDEFRRQSLYKGTPMQDVLKKHAADLANVKETDSAKAANERNAIKKSAHAEAVEVLHGKSPAPRVESKATETTDAPAVESASTTETPTSSATNSAAPFSPEIPHVREPEIAEGGASASDGAGSSHRDDEQTAPSFTHDQLDAAGAGTDGPRGSDGSNTTVADPEAAPAPTGVAQPKPRRVKKTTTATTEAQAEGSVSPTATADADAESIPSWEDNEPAAEQQTPSEPTTAESEVPSPATAPVVDGPPKINSRVGQQHFDAVHGQDLAPVGQHRNVSTDSDVHEPTQPGDAVNSEDIGVSNRKGGKKSYFAEIRGPHDKWGFDREFQNEHATDWSNYDNATGKGTWDKMHRVPPHGGVFETQEDGQRNLQVFWPGRKNGSPGLRSMDTTPEDLKTAYAMLGEHGHAPHDVTEAAGYRGGLGESLPTRVAAYITAKKREQETGAKAEGGESSSGVPNSATATPAVASELPPATPPTPPTPAPPASTEPEAPSTPTPATPQPTGPADDRESQKAQSGPKSQQMSEPSPTTQADSRPANSNPDHPVAKAIAADTETHAFIESVRDMFSKVPQPASREQINQRYVQHDEDLKSLTAKPYDPKNYEEHRQKYADLHEHDRTARAAVDQANLEARQQVIDHLKPTTPIKVKTTINAQSAKNPNRVKAISEGVNFLESVCHGDHQADVKFVPDRSRAFYINGYKEIGLTTKCGPATVAHELGHALEDQNPKIKEAVKEFLAYRLGNEQSVKMRDLPGGGEYSEHEMGRKDNFDRAFSGTSAYYVGKEYKNGATEVLSMGIEALMNRPAEFIAKDPEYAAFVMRILKGKVSPQKETLNEQDYSMQQSQPLEKDLLSSQERTWTGGWKSTDANAGHWTPEERDALHGYGDNTFIKVNGELRNGYASNGTKKLTKKIDACIQKNPTKPPRVVYRGLAGSVVGHLEVGDTFRDPAYFSTSRKRDTAEHFSNESPDGKILIIQVPQGARAADLELLRGDEDQAESLFPRNTAIKVVKIKGNKIYAKMLLRRTSQG